jgi:hypothetical protein
MSTSRWLSALLLAALLALASRPAPALETPWYEALWLEPPGAQAPLPALLTLPPAWLSGDAAVVLLSDSPMPGPLHQRAMEAILAADAGVLELDPTAGEAGITGTAPERAADPTLAAALLVLRRDIGAGLIVAVGFGRAGEAALRAAEASAAGSLLPGLAAAAALGRPADGPAPDFRVGALPPEAEQWLLRAPLFCGLLADLAGGAEARSRCVAALLVRPAPLLAAWEE